MIIKPLSQNYVPDLSVNSNKAHLFALFPFLESEEDFKVHNSHFKSGLAVPLVRCSLHMYVLYSP